MAKEVAVEVAGFLRFKIRLFFKQNRVGVMELCAASLRFTASL